MNKLLTTMMLAVGSVLLRMYTVLCQRIGVRRWI